MRSPHRWGVPFNAHIHRWGDRCIDRFSRARRGTHARQGIRFQNDDGSHRRLRIGTFAHDDVDDDDDDDRAPDGDARGATRDRGARCGRASDDGATGTYGVRTCDDAGRGCID